MIIMADVPDGHGETPGATMFLTKPDVEGIRMVRPMNTMDESFTGGHWEIEYDNLCVPRSEVLGAVGEGFRYVQVRLAPARLTHCMRWLGGASRAHDIALNYAREREAFGKTIGRHEGIGLLATTRWTSAGTPPHLVGLRCYDQGKGSPRILNGEDRGLKRYTGSPTDAFR